MFGDPLDLPFENQTSGLARFASRRPVPLVTKNYAGVALMMRRRDFLLIPIAGALA